MDKVRRVRIAKSFVCFFIATTALFGGAKAVTFFAEEKGFSDGYNGQVAFLDGKSVCSDILRSQDDSVLTGIAKGFCRTRRELFDIPYLENAIEGLKAGANKMKETRLNEAREKEQSENRQEPDKIVPAAPSPFSPGPGEIRQIDPKGLMNKGNDGLGLL